MSIRLMAQIWDNEDHDLSGSKLLIMLCLADHSNDDGVCWPSINRLAERTRIERRNVIRHLHTLEEFGYLEIIRTPGRSNRYIVRGTRGNIATGGKIDTGGKNVTTTRGKIDTGTRGKIDTGGVVISPPEPSYNHHTEPSIESSSDGKAEDALIDPELRQVISQWNEAFSGTAWEGNAPVAQLPKWLAYAGVEVMCYMIGKAKDKDNPGGYLYTTFDNWRKDGEVAPYIVNAARDAAIASQPVVMAKKQVTWADGSTQEVEVATRGI